MNIKKLLKFPTPKELGMSNCDNAMPMKMFSDGNRPTWEDYYEHLKNNYPVKYKIYSIYNVIISSIKLYFKPIKDLFYWFKCMILPKYKYHLLNLRQPYNKEETDFYKYGYIDVSERIVFAIMNLLREHVKHSYDVTIDHTEEQAEKEGFLNQYLVCKEAKRILHWWDVSRKSDIKMLNTMSHEWHQSFETTGSQSEQTKKLLEQHSNAEIRMNQELDDMLIRVIKIRQSLWN